MYAGQRQDSKYAPEEQQITTNQSTKQSLHTNVYVATHHFQPKASSHKQTVMKLTALPNKNELDLMKHQLVQQAVNLSMTIHWQTFSWKWQPQDVWWQYLSTGHTDPWKQQKSHQMIVLRSKANAWNNRHILYSRKHNKQHHEWKTLQYGNEVDSPYTFPIEENYLCKRQLSRQSWGNKAGYKKGNTN